VTCDEGLDGSPDFLIDVGMDVDEFWVFLDRAARETASPEERNQVAGEEAQPRLSDAHRRFPGPPGYRAPRIRELLRAFSSMPATVIGERIGWTRSIRVPSGRVAELRPAYLPPDPARRTSYAEGEIAQCDFWFPDIGLPVGPGQVRTARRLPVLTMACGYSRWLSAVLVPSRQAEGLFAGWWGLIEALGAVPRTLVSDGEGAVGRWRAGKPELTGDCQAFRGTLGVKVIICRPADPEGKDYLERSFLPGRSFAGPADFNAQLRGWLARANTRRMRVLDCSPAERVGAADPRTPRPAGLQRLLGAPGRHRTAYRRYPRRAEDARWWRLVRRGVSIYAN
jgi:transposase